MKLYFSPFACSAAVRIAFYEADIRVDYIQVGNGKMTDQGQDFLSVAPKGQVAALQLDDETVLTENVAILQFISDMKPDLELAPLPVSPERYAKLSFLSKHFENNKYLMGRSFSVADIYLFWALGMFKHLSFSICDENIKNYLKSIESRPAVIKAMRDEELAAQNTSI